MSNTILQEGMREGDLADLVLPLISVDEYVSKVDPDECIVFGFYVHDQDAADDLNRFLQKSSTPILDTEISPAPDQHGYYMVFMEIMDNDRLPENITSVLAEIKTLVDIDEWQMRVRKSNGLIPFSEDNIKDCLARTKRSEKNEDVLEFFRPSLLSDALFEGDVLILRAGAERFAHRFVAFDRLTKLMLDANLGESPVALNLRTVAKMNRIQRCLGESWDVSNLGRYILIQSSSDSRGLLLIK